jgi:hypothetical protein
MVATITDVDHAPIRATNTFDIFAEGSAAKGSEIEVHFDLGDAVPTFGHSWSLVESPLFTNAAVGVTSNATFKPGNVHIDHLDVPGLRAELAYKTGGSLGQVLAVDVLNNLNLKVDPVTGAASVENAIVGGDAFDIDGILITSASGSLNAAGYDGLGLAGWQPGLNQSGSVLSESNLLASSSLAVGTSIDLGNLFEIGGTQDLVFEFHVAGGKTIRGTVEYASGPVGTEGDTDGDGDVDLEDLNAVRNNFGASAPSPLTHATNAVRRDREKTAAPRMETSRLTEHVIVETSSRLALRAKQTMQAADVLFAAWEDEPVSATAAKTRRRF